MLEVSLPVWLEGLRFAWALVVAGYGITGVYLRAFSTEDYPAWCWQLFLAIAGAIALAVNASSFIENESILLVFEAFAIATLATTGLVLFVFVKEHGSEIDDPIIRFLELIGVK